MRPWRDATEYLRRAHAQIFERLPASMRPWRDATEYWAGTGFAYVEANELQ